MRLGGAEPAGQPQGHPRALETGAGRLPAVGQVAWSATRRTASSAAARAAASAGSVAAASARGEPAEPRLPGQRRQAAEVGQRRGLDLAEQRVGPQQVGLRPARARRGPGRRSRRARRGPGAGRRPAGSAGCGGTAPVGRRRPGGRARPPPRRRRPRRRRPGPGASRAAPDSTMSRIDSAAGPSVAARRRTAAVAEVGGRRAGSGPPRRRGGPAEQARAGRARGPPCRRRGGGWPARRWRRRARRPGPGDTRRSGGLCSSRASARQRLAERRVELARLEEALDPLPGVDRRRACCGPGGRRRRGPARPAPARSAPRSAAPRASASASASRTSRTVSARTTAKLALAQVQLAVALPGARGVQADDEGVGVLLADPGDLDPELVGRQRATAAISVASSRSRLQSDEPASPSPSPRSGLELGDLGLPGPRRDLFLPLLDRLPVRRAEVSRFGRLGVVGVLGLLRRSGAGSPSSRASSRCASRASTYSSDVRASFSVLQQSLGLVGRSSSRSGRPRRTVSHLRRLSRARRPRPHAQAPAHRGGRGVEPGLGQMLQGGRRVLADQPGQQRVDRLGGPPARGLGDLGVRDAQPGQGLADLADQVVGGVPAPLGLLLDLPARAATFAAVSSAVSKSLDPEDLLRPAPAPPPTRPRRAGPAAAAPARRGRLSRVGVRERPRSR